MAVDPDRKYLFAGRRLANEYGMTSFKIDQKNGGLTAISSIPLQGDPVHISTDKTGRYLLSAYYYQKTAGVHSIGERRYTRRPARGVAGNRHRGPLHPRPTPPTGMLTSPISPMGR